MAAKYDESLHFYIYGRCVSVRQRLNMADKTALDAMGADFQRATLEVELNTDGALKILMKIYAKSNYNHQYNVVSNCKLNKIKYLNPKSPYSANIVSVCKNLNNQIDRMIRAARFALGMVNESGFNMLQKSMVNLLDQYILDFQVIPESDGSRLSISVDSHYDWAMRHVIDQLIALAFANVEFVTGQADEFTGLASAKDFEQVKTYAKQFDYLAQQRQAVNEQAKKGVA